MNTLVQSKDDVLTTIRAHQERICAFGVKRLGLFGSFATQRQRPESDIDILVSFEEGRKTFDNFMELAFFLEELLGRRVELVTTEALSPYIGPHIMREVEYVITD